MPDRPENRAHGRNRKVLAYWLVACCALIFLMIVVGGATRLTNSGLSMVEWRFIGTLPPLHHSAWQAEFEKYRQHPEFRKLRPWMTVKDFKPIYWLEYAHRMIGRVIGVCFAVPLIYFLATRRIRGWLAVKLMVVLSLGAAQGILGWAMVRSGLIERPDVSHYRLAAHLGLAVILYSYLVWTVLDVLSPATVSRKSSPAVWVLVFLVFVTIVSGSLVAGLDAGFAYNSFPLMDRQLIPAGLFAHSPWYANLTENVVTVQFDHRWLGILTLVSVLALWLRGRSLHPRSRLLTSVVLAAAVGQTGLGIGALVLVVPVVLGLAHQAGSLVLLTVVLIVAHMSRVAPREAALAQPRRQTSASA